MRIENKNSLGTIEISKDAIAQVVASATLECYGVVGLAKSSALREEMAKILKQPDYTQAIRIKGSKQPYSVDLFLVVAQDVKITEVVNEVQKKVRYVLEQTFQMKFAAVNVFVQSLYLEGSL